MRLTISTFWIQYRRHGPSGAEPLLIVVLLRAVSHRQVRTCGESEMFRTISRAAGIADATETAEGKSPSAVFPYFSTESRADEPGMGTGPD